MGSRAIRLFAASVAVTMGAYAEVASAAASEWTVAGRSQPTITGRPLSAGTVATTAVSYEDVMVRVRFTCATACDFSLLLAPRNSGDGWQGVYVPVSPEGVQMGRATLSRGGQVSGFDALQISESSIFGRTVAQAGPRRPASAAQQQNPMTKLRSGENTLEVFVSGDVVSGRLNGERLGQALAPAAERLGYGPVVVTVRGGDPRFSVFEVKDGLVRPGEEARTEAPFTMRRASDLYYAESIAYGDFDKDGVTDVASGPWWYKGPDFHEAREIYLTTILGPMAASGSYFSAAYDFNSDGYDDIVEMGGPGSPGWLYINPGVERRRWAKYKVYEGLSTETGVMGDVDGDGKPEFAFGIGDRAGYVKPGSDPTQPWTVKIVSGEGWTMSQHGVGIGDISGDGRADYIVSNGWFEQPASGPDGQWQWRPYQFGTATARESAGATAQMFAYDVNGDGLNDVVTALAAHGWGIAWFQQVKGSDGRISFVKHDVMTDDWPPNKAAVFSEPHAFAVADIDGDGLIDLVSGKRWFAHRDSQIDPDPLGPAVVYWFKLIRGPNGAARFEPRLINNSSGVGTNIAVADVDGDKRVDVLTANRKGVFVFLNNHPQR